MSIRGLINCQAIKFSYPHKVQTLAPGRLGGVANTDLKWKPGQILNIKFKGGTDTVRAKVQAAASQWTKYANLKFNFVDDSYPLTYCNIYIGFDAGVGNASTIGKESLIKINQNETSMNLEGCTDQQADDRFTGIVLHEFGHALGLYHEHQNPVAGGVEIDNTKAINYYHGQYTIDQVLTNFGALAPSLNIDTSKTFDIDSIMIYPIPFEVQKNTIKKVIAERYVLSKGDIEFIKKCYP